jgi:hypothetical protein
METKSRVAAVLESYHNMGAHETNGLIRAYCVCLNPEERVDILVEALDEAHSIRDAVLRLVCNDMERSFARQHDTLFELLLNGLAVADAKGRQSIAYCLSRLVVNAPVDWKQKVQATFLDSRYKGMRRRAYKALARDLVLPFDSVVEAWQRHGDAECAYLIVQHFPVRYLIEHYEQLRKQLPEHWQLSKLYLKLGEHDHSVLEDLRAIDGISFAYVRAKLERPLETAEAIELVDQCMEDERFGLLVWSLGQMGLWDALRHVEARAH